MRLYDVETRLPPEAEAALKARIGLRVEGDRVVFFIGETRLAELTAAAVLRAVAPNTLELGDSENYLHSITTANVIIASRPETKARAERITAEEPPPLPEVIKYVRAEGKGGEEIGFDSETAPEMVKTPEGDIDLKALVALLALRLARLERRLEKLSG
jgi:hypothetical protein